MSKALLKITRGNEYFGMGRKLKIYVDDVQVGEAGWNETADLAVEPGNHRVYVKMDWCRSATQTIDIGGAGTIEFRVTIPSGLLAQWAALVLKPSHFFGLDRR